MPKIPGLLEYINYIQQGGRGTCTLYLVGNQSADLDSVVSSLILSYALAQLSPYNLQVYPIVNTERDVFSEFTTAAIGKGHITPDLLFFIEDPVIRKDMWREHSFTGRKWILLDHNDISERARGWWDRGCVVGVFDHHADQSREEALAKNPEMIYCNTAVLGSTCTIITEMVLGLDPPDGAQSEWLEELIRLCGFEPTRPAEAVSIDEDCMKLLLMTIQEDTADFAPELYQNRWQDRDKAAADALIKALDLEDGSSLQEARKVAREKALSFMSQESWIKIIQSDLKVYHGITPRPLPFASLPFPLHLAGRSRELARTLLDYLEGHGMNEMCILSRDGTDRFLWHFQLIGSPTELKQTLVALIGRPSAAAEADSRYVTETARDCMDRGITAGTFKVDSTWSRKLIEGKLRQAFAARKGTACNGSSAEGGSSHERLTPSDPKLLT